MCVCVCVCQSDIPVFVLTSGTIQPSMQQEQAILLCKSCVSWGQREGHHINILSIHVIIACAQIP